MVANVCSCLFDPRGGFQLTQRGLWLTFFPFLSYLSRPAIPFLLCSAQQPTGEQKKKLAFIKPTRGPLCSFPVMEDFFFVRSTSGGTQQLWEIRRGHGSCRADPPAQQRRRGPTPSVLAELRRRRTSHAAHRRGRGRLPPLRHGSPSKHYMAANPAACAPEISPESFGQRRSCWCHCGGHDHDHNHNPESSTRNYSYHGDTHRATSICPCDTSSSSVQGKTAI